MSDFSVLSKGHLYLAFIYLAFIVFMCAFIPALMLAPHTEAEQPVLEFRQADNVPAVMEFRQTDNVPILRIGSETPYYTVTLDMDYATTVFLPMGREWLCAMEDGKEERMVCRAFAPPLALGPP